MGNGSVKSRPQSVDKTSGNNNLDTYDNNLNTYNNNSLPTNNNNIVRCGACAISSDVLPCGHSLCAQCQDDLVQRHLASDTSSVKLPCPVCRHVYDIPVSEPSSPDGSQILDPAVTFDPDIMTDYICTRSGSDCQRVWSHTAACDIQDVALLYDKNVLLVLHPSDESDHRKTLTAVDAAGQSSESPVPGVFVSPQGVRNSADGRTLTLLDRVDGDRSHVIVYYNKPSVDCWIQIHTIRITAMEWLDRISPIVHDQFSCMSYVGNLLLTYDINGRLQWSCKLANETPNIGGKCVDMSASGDVIAAVPKSYTRKSSVTVYNRDGTCKYEFSKEDIKNACAVCFTCRGHVIIANWAERKVLLYTGHTQLIRTILTLENTPTNLAILDDKYLVIAYSNKTIEMYTL